MILIRNINLMNLYEIFFGYSMVVDEDKIVDIGMEGNIKIENIDLVIDGKGNFLASSFIDIHNHGNMKVL
ncbi:hypothetical protein [Tissierella carlieri]|uniref:hypothetical protein n=2 Tax=Tissierella TaxID=41273 RepID=UPI001C108743|nr:hypothetical protein [Tissierella carlieri]